MFSNRQQAGALLAKKIADFIRRSNRINQSQIIVLALPRGGVPVALEIALAIGCPLNVLASKKIGAPDQKELAVGAVTSDGLVVVDEVLTRYLSIPASYIEKEKEYLINKTRQLEQRWRNSAGIDSKLDIGGKAVIVVDDGVATGMTAIAAGRSLRGQGASQVLLATPVIAANTLNRLSAEYDQIMVLESPVVFGSVGQFYLDFHQVEDLEVVQALAQAMNQNCVKSL